MLQLLLHAIFGDGKSTRIRSQVKFDLTCDAVSAGFSKFDFSGCESEIKFFGGPFGNRKICIVCGKAWITSGVLWSAEVLHFAVDGLGG